MQVDHVRQLLGIDHAPAVADPARPRGPTGPVDEQLRARGERVVDDVVDERDVDPPRGHVRHDQDGTRPVLEGTEVLLPRLVVHVAVYLRRL